MRRKSKKTLGLYLAVLALGAFGVGLIEILPGYLLATELVYGRY